MTNAKQKFNYSDMLGFLGDVGPPMFDEATLANVGASGVGLMHMTSAWPFLDWEATLEMHRRLVGELSAHGEMFQLIGAREDLAEAQQKLRIGVLVGLQDPTCIGERLERVVQLYDAGVRILQVAYQRRGPYGCGFLIDADDSGLTDTGRKFVRMVNDSGIILDLAHSAPQTALDCLRWSAGPTLVSHTSCRGAYDHPRGVTDEVIAAITQREDVIVGVLAMTFFLAADEEDLEPMIRHICYLAERIGPQRVVIGTDGPVGGFTDLAAAEKRFCETTQKMMDPQGEIRSRWPTHIPAVAKDPKGFERIGRSLKPHFTKPEIEGILGKNARRFFERHLPPGRKEKCTTS